MSLFYYRLGNSYPRTFLRKPYVRKKRTAFILSHPKIEASANLYCVSSIAATAKVSQKATATLSCTASVSASSLITNKATANLNSVSSITANGQTINKAAANLQSIATIAATATTKVYAAASLASITSVSATAKVQPGSPYVYASAFLSATSTLSAKAKVTTIPTPQPRDWNLVGVYAVFPTNARRQRYIEINFKFLNNTYQHSRFIDGQTVMYIKDVNIIPHEIKPSITLNNIDKTENSLPTLYINNIKKQKPKMVLESIGKT